MSKIIFQGYEHYYQRMLYFLQENKSIKTCDICFLGDSLTEMMDITNFNGLFCVNRGIISDKSAGILMSLMDRVIAISPKKVFLLIGSNDICDGYDIAEIIGNINKIINMLKENLKDVDIMVSTILPPCYYEASHVDPIYPNCRDILRIKELNNQILKLKDVRIFDSFKVLADENDSLRAKDTLDGVHLTKDAYKILLNEISKVL